MVRGGIVEIALAFPTNPRSLPAEHITSSSVPSHDIRGSSIPSAGDAAFSVLGVI